HEAVQNGLLDGTTSSIDRLRQSLLAAASQTQALSNASPDSSQ
ncbi:MAG: phosphate acyltransferase, partial [Alcaligenaceae bacterium]|nr:phosphate acyltransferase [Alcaligenaceae bacterium]